MAGKQFDATSALKVGLTARQQGKVSIARALKEHFGDRDDVEAIYLNLERGHYRAIILTRHGHYERDAMSALFEREYRLRDQLEDVPIEIDYVPLLERHPEDLVPDTAAVCRSTTDGERALQ